jgi:hypothetical protein
MSDATDGAARARDAAIPQSINVFIGLPFPRIVVL